MFFILSRKLFPFLRSLHFCSDLFGYVGKQLEKKAKKNFKICDVTNWNTNNYNNVLADISKNKGNQTIKFGQLIEYKRSGHNGNL